MNNYYDVGSYGVTANIYYDNVNKCYWIGYHFGGEYVIANKQFETEEKACDYLVEKFSLVYLHQL